jgi:hypothetical protein
MTSVEEPGNDLSRRVVEGNAQGRALAHQLSQTAGRIAATEIDVARVHEQVPGPASRGRPPRPLKETSTASFCGIRMSSGPAIWLLDDGEFEDGW